MGRHKITEEDLVALLKAQDERGVNILYDNYSPALYGVIYRIVQVEEIAEDILQDTFVKIWKNFSQYDGTKGRLFTWIVNVARNLAIDKVRSKDFVNSTKNLSLNNTVSYIDLNISQTYNPDTIGVKQMINKLMPEQKKIIDLLYFKGCTQAEVAELLDIPLGTVKTRARTALSMLRKEFNELKLS